jgi:hypothetical protein
MSTRLLNYGSICCLSDHARSLDHGDYPIANITKLPGSSFNIRAFANLSGASHA